MFFFLMSTKGYTFVSNLSNQVQRQDLSQFLSAQQDLNTLKSMIICSASVELEVQASVCSSIYIFFNLELYFSISNIVLDVVFWSWC